MCRDRHPDRSQRSTTQLCRDERELGEALRTCGLRVIDRAETTYGFASGRKLGKWTSNLLVVVEVSFCRRPRIETNLGRRRSMGFSTSLLCSRVHRICPLLTPLFLPPLTTLFDTTLSFLSILIKRSLHKYTFHTHASYSALPAHQDRWDELITRRAERKENELKEDLHTLRGVFLCSFPEFLADLKLAGLRGGGEFGTGCADFTVTVRLSLALSCGLSQHVLL